MGAKQGAGAAAGAAPTAASGAAGAAAALNPVTGALSAVGGLFGAAAGGGPSNAESSTRVDTGTVFGDVAAPSNTPVYVALGVVGFAGLIYFLVNRKR